VSDQRSNQKLVDELKQAIPWHQGGRLSYLEEVDNQRRLALNELARRLEIAEELATDTTDMARRLAEADEALREILMHGGGEHDNCRRRPSDPHHNCRSVIFKIARAYFRASEGGEKP